MRGFYRSPARSLSSIVCSLRCRKTFSSAIPACSTNSSNAGSRSGARPLFFLDYIAVGKVVPSMLADIVRGVVRGCREARCALVGGETAELPGLYGPGKWDLAGFCVGLVDEPKIIDGRTCRAGDAVIGTVLLYSAYIILNSINHDLVDQKARTTTNP